MANGVHEFEDDPRNAHVRVWMNGALVPRGEAKVSVLDGGFVFGDGVWEGLRLHQGRFLFLEQHLDRLWEGLRTLMIDPGLDRAALVRALYETVDANGMTDGVHLRLMVTRGLRRTPYQDPRMTVGPATIVILPEHKVPRPDVVARGVTLATVHVRRGYPDVQDPKLNSHSKLNCITACIQATQAGADEALMLDPHGFVATCNSTHFFVVRKGEVWTSTGRYCLPGITRAAVLRACREAGMTAVERDFSLTEVYGADEAFVTGTFAGVVHVRSVDGRTYADDAGPVVLRVRELYRELCAREPGRP
ncbi:MAG: aminotransferase class IV [Myxococcales bacterium]|nr:aminotransferase class IV [Myxococcales bacterium]